MSNSQELQSELHTEPQKSDKFKLLCACINLIERRYDGKRSRLNLKGFCDRIHLRKQKYNEMVEKAPVEVILYLMGVLVKLIEDIENGKNKTFCREPEEDATTDEDKQRILNMVMDRMVQEEREDQQRRQQMMQEQIQGQIQYATQVASQYLPGFFQGGAPNVVIPGVGNYPMGTMYGGGIGMNGGGGYRTTPEVPLYNAGALPQPFQNQFFQQYTQSQSHPQYAHQSQPQSQSHPQYAHQSHPQYAHQSQPQSQSHPQYAQQSQPQSQSQRYQQQSSKPTSSAQSRRPVPPYPTQPHPTHPTQSQRYPSSQPQQHKPFDFENEFESELKNFGNFNMDFDDIKTNNTVSSKKGRGRPKGVKNKPKKSGDSDGGEDEDEKPKKTRGRPKGAKNKE
jgi:hypothetical protein